MFKIRKRALVLAASAAAAVGLSLGTAGLANASVGPIQSTPAGLHSIAGYYAHATNDAVSFTHISTTEGGNGTHSIEQLPVSTDTDVNGAAGIGICNQSTGNAAQLGLVYLGGGLVDVVYGTGNFGSLHVNNGDKCQGGLVAPTNGRYLAGPFSDNNSFQLDVLYDAANTHPSFRGHHFSQGSIIFSVTDISTAPGVSYLASVHAPGRTFNEADAGVVSDTNNNTALPGTAPYPYGGHSTDPNELEGFSHTLANGNEVIGGSEVHGSFYNNAAWNAFSVDATANGKTYLGPTVFVNDGFLVLVGAPTSGGAPGPVESLVS